MFDIGWSELVVIAVVALIAGVALVGRSAAGALVRLREHPQPTDLDLVRHQQT